MANTTGYKGKDQGGTAGFGEKARDTATSYTDKAKDAAASAAESARETAVGVADKAREMASDVGHRASDMATTVGHKAEDATAAVGSGMKSLAGTIRENVPDSGVLGSAGSSLASSLESGGRYLQEEGLQGVANDLTNLIRRNPIPALFVGIGIGYLLARSTRS
jgi:hypothetical protein